MTHDQLLSHYRMARLFFFFFYARSTPPPTDAISRTASNRIESPCLSTHIAPHAQLGGSSVAIGFPGVFSDAFCGSLAVIK
jgi:hypothetical protein